MRLSLLSCSTALLLLLVGCSTSQNSTLPSADSDAGQSLLDSLQTEVVRLRDRNRALHDSLQFYDDVESGQYARNMRSLEEQLSRLTYEVRLLRSGGQTVSVLPADSLFASGVDSIGAGGVKRLKRLAQQLESTYADRTIRVEGHSDNAALGPSLQKRYASNWALSAARATSVVDRLIRLTSLDRSQFVAVGYGASRPRASNETASGRRRNRRVRVAVLPVPRDYSRPYQTTW